MRRATDKGESTVDETRIELPQWEPLPDIGLDMDQVLTLMERTFAPFLPGAEITKSMVNNYVKVGLIKRPVGKRYDREHLALLIMIGVLKQALSMECIAQVLECLCGRGVREGYLAFAQDVRALSEGMSGAAAGNAGASGAEATPSVRAAQAGVTAAVYTIHARRLLSGLREEKSAAGGSMKRG